MNVIQAGTGFCALVAAVTGGFAFLDARHAPMAEFHEHLVAELTAEVRQLRKDIRTEPPGTFRDLMCDDLDYLLVLICDESPDHPYCARHSEILEEDCLGS